MPDVPELQPDSADRAPVALGARSFIYRARRPFDAGRIGRLLLHPPPGVLVGRGLFWIAERPDRAGRWTQSGPTISIEPAGVWWAAVPRERWPDPRDRATTIDAVWEEPHGDRRQEFLFVGIEFDERAIRSALDACLRPDDGRAPGIRARRTPAGSLPRVRRLSR